MPVLTFLDSISRGMSGVFVLGCFSLLVVGPFSYFPILPPHPVLVSTRDSGCWEDKIKRVTTRKRLVYLLWKSVQYFES